MRNYDQQKASEVILRRIKHAAERLKCAWRISNRGVPHLLVQIGSQQASVAWFGSTRTWRVFYPYLGSNQQKQTCKTLHEVERYLQDLRNGTQGMRNPTYEELI
jgi:hypothetical protein